MRSLVVSMKFVAVAKSRTLFTITNDNYKSFSKNSLANRRHFAALL